MTFLVLFFIQNCNLVSLRCDLSGRSPGLPFINAYETEGYSLDRFVTVEQRNLRPSIRKSGAGGSALSKQRNDLLCGYFPVSNYRSTKGYSKYRNYLRNSSDTGVVLLFRQKKKN